MASDRADAQTVSQKAVGEKLVIPSQAAVKFSWIRRSGWRWSSGLD